MSENCWIGKTYITNDLVTSSRRLYDYIITWRKEEALYPQEHR